MIRKSWLLMCLAAPVSGLWAQQATLQKACPAIAPADEARLQAYLARQYSLPNGATLSMVSSTPLADSCIRQVTFAADWPKITITVMLSPDGRYAFPGAYDLSKAPVAPARLAAAAAPSTPAAMVPLSEADFTEIAKGTPLVFGPASAPVTIVEFSDLECPFCRQLATTLRGSLLPAHAQDLRLVYRQFPLSIHAWALPAAEMSECAGQQNVGAFWALHDFLFDHQATLSAANLRDEADKFVQEQKGIDVARFDSCLNIHAMQGKVQADIALGNKLGVHSTPTYFINGQPLAGAKSLSDLEAAIVKAKGAGGLQ